MSYSDILNTIGLNNELRRLKEQAEISWNKEYRILTQFGLKDKMRVLEVGSGPGFYSKLLLETFPNIELYCLEINQNLMDVAKKNLINYNNRIHFIYGNVEKTNFIDNSFDIVITRLVFQHLTRPQNAMSEIFRILKPNGKNIILDIDNELWGLTEPYNELIYATNKSMASYQHSKGCDRNIGRKLLRIMKNSNFSNLDFDIIATNSDVVGLNKLLGVNSIEEAIQNFSNNFSGTQSNVKRNHINFLHNQDSCIILLMIAACGTKILSK